MLKKHRLLIFLIMLFSFANLAYSQSDFDVDITANKSVIYEDEVAEYDLTISNNAGFEEIFLTPYTSDVGWIIITDPSTFKVPALSNKTFKLYVDPKTTVSPGQYGVTLNLKSSITEEIDKSLFLIFIKPLNPLPQGYRASIALNVELPTDIDPRQEVPVSVYLRNRNAKEFNNLTIEIHSKLINKIIHTNFSSLEERTEKYSFALSEYETPQEDQLIVKLLDGTKEVNKVKIPINVISYSEIKEEKNSETNLLKTVTTIKLTNSGNVANDNPYKYEIGFLENIFTSSTLDHKTVKEDFRYVTFPVSLEPGQSITLSITTNYRYIVYTLIIILLIIILYYKLRSPILSRREAITNEYSKEGVSEFKIRLIVRNRSQKPVENCKIIESIPSLASLIKESSVVGTIEPTKIIKHDKRGTIIRWDINYLEPFEERIITYKIKSKLNIVGSLTLPNTKIKYETVKGKEKVAYSKKHKIKIFT